MADVFRPHSCGFAAMHLPDSISADAARCCGYGKNCAEKSASNPAVIYAAIRNALYNSGKNRAICYIYPKLQYVAEW